MLDIRKMLEEQLVKLQDASMNPEATADCTYAMLAIVDVLYPEGVPRADKVATISKLPSAKDLAIPSVCCVNSPSARVEIDSENVVSMVVDHVNRQSKLIIGDRSLELRIE